MKSVFWFFQSVFTGAFILTVVMMAKAQSPQWNIALALVYIVTQIILWAGWRLTQGKDDVGKFFTSVLIADVIAGLMASIFFATANGFINDDWKAVLVGTILTWLAVIVLGNAPTALVLYAFAHGKLPQVEIKKSKKKLPAKKPTVQAPQPPSEPE